MLTRQEIEQALEELGALLARQNKVGEIAIYGGTAILLQFEATFRTHDLDVTINAEHGAVTQGAQEIALGRGWPGSWLNEAVTMYVGPEPDTQFYRTFPEAGAPGLRVFVARPEYLLAMKLAALRTTGRDMQDVKLLCRATGVRSVEQMLRAVERHLGERPDPRRFAAMQQIAEELSRETPDAS